MLNDVIINIPILLMRNHIFIKISYLVKLLKMIASITPRTRAVTSNISKQTVAPSPTPKPSSPRGDVSLKLSTPSGGVGVSKASTSSSKVAPKSPTGVSSTSAYSDGNFSVSRPTGA